MNAARIEKELRHARAYRVTVVDQTTSTNDEMRSRARQGAPEGEVLIARRQTGGRGRLGRSFFSPEGGLYLSLLLRPEEPAEQAVRITVIAAVAAAEAAEDVFGGSLTVKWVNDLYRGGRKVAGILTEAETDPSSDRLLWAVLGIGFNVTPPAEGFPAQVADRAGALCVSCAEADRERLAARFLDRFFVLRQTAWQTVLAEYRRRSFLIGRQVTASSFPGVLTVLDVDDRARLCVRANDGKEYFLSSGEVSVVPL